MKYFDTAFLHSSYTNENHLKSDYERLEFLGDAVLKLIMSDYLYKHMDIKEGDMTKIRESYVCENALYEFSLGLNLSKYIKVVHGEEQDAGRFKKVIVADVFEALMDAVYLDLGFNTVKRIILDVTVPYIEDPKVVSFNDYVQVKQSSLIYEVTDESGLDHNKSLQLKLK